MLWFARVSKRDFFYLAEEGCHECLDNLTIRPSNRLHLRCGSFRCRGGQCWGRACRAAQVAQDHRALLRFDPLGYAPDAPDRATLVPVTEQEVKVGCIYSHFSERLNRRVWAIWQANGQFSHALGEGTTQPGPAFDIRGTTEEKRAKLEQTDYELLRKMDRQGGYVYFRLNQDNSWQLAPSTSDHATIYDAETQYCWEWAYGRYIPISSAPFAYRWRVVNGSYVPVEDPSSSETGCVFAIPQIETVPRCKCDL